MDNKEKFSVWCLETTGKENKWENWSEGLTMYIVKDGIKIKLENEEIKKLVKSLPTTFGGSY